MNAKVLIAGVAIAVMAAGASSAKMHKHMMHKTSMSDGAYAAPAEPIPYAQMDSRMSSEGGMGMKSADGDTAMAKSGGDMGMKKSSMHRSMSKSRMGHSMKSSSMHSNGTTGSNTGINKPMNGDAPASVGATPPN